MIINTSSVTAYSQETMSISEKLELSDLIVRRNDVGSSNERMTILRAEHGDQFIEVLVE